MQYLYNSKKISRKAHLLNGDQRTFCQIENSEAFKNLDEVTNTKPADREICGICEHKSQKPPKQQKKKRQDSGGFYLSWEWAEARYDTLKRYRAVCMCCGATKNICVDHIKPRTKYPDLELNRENLQVLCSLCNRGKGRRDETDWRPK